MSITNDIYLEIPRGHIDHHHGVNKFGRNSAIDSATPEDIWDGGGIWVPPTQARKHDIASTSTNDTSAGTGARKIRIYGLPDWDTKEVYEEITMNGISDVETVNSYVIIHRMKVLSKGSGDVNAGTITATAQTDGTVTAQITPGEGQTQMAIFGIPSSQIAYMTQLYASVNRATTTGAVDIALKMNVEPNVDLTNFTTKHTRGLQVQGTSNLEHPFKPYAKYEGPAIFKLHAAVTANSSDISGGFDLILCNTQ